MKRLLASGLVLLLVIILGALTGWYLFLRTERAQTVSEDSARGFASSGTFGSTSQGDTTGSGGFSQGTQAQRPPQLWHLATTPAAGIAFATSSEGALVRYVERATGYVFDANPASGSVTRRTHTLMPKIYEASIAQDAVIERSLDSSGAITTFIGTVPASTTPDGELAGSALARNISTISFAPGSALVFLVPQSGGSALMQTDLAGNKGKTLYTSNLSDWRVSATDAGVVLVQNAADSLPGYAYLLQKGALSPLIRSVPGLSLLPRADGKAFLYSTSNGSPSLFAKINDKTVTLDLATVAEKCVWDNATRAYCAVPVRAPASGFLDAWYRGEVHTTDALWQLDVAAETAQLLFTPGGSLALDMQELALDPSGAYLAFINGADGSPWVLRINN